MINAIKYSKELLYIQIHEKQMIPKIEKNLSMPREDVGKINK